MIETDFLVTSESVSKAHPDKLCDRVSDAILDKYLECDEYSRVAIETMISNNVLFIAGEVTSKGKVDIDKVAKEVLKESGYDRENVGFNCNKCLIFKNINKQSTDIDLGVSHNNKVGAGDQGIMYGFACDETKGFIPITADLSSKLCEKLDQIKKNKKNNWLLPDGKAQITMLYDKDGNPKKISSIIVSTQHVSGVSYETIHFTILNEVIYDVIPSKYLSRDTEIYINPTGRFVIGGPEGDVGVTGRKIMVDTYGGIARHGGGAFSGKDSTKVDRSGAYMARYVAKNIVAAGLARKCEVSIAYAIGKTDPEMVEVNTFSTEKIPKEYIKAAVNEIFSFSVEDILKNLQLRKPQFLKTAAYGHFGREDQGFKWEETDKAEELKKIAFLSFVKDFKKNKLI
ncbi:methionine adenosyltransferase [Fusobacterium sp. IOR10]|uniref:methionine adenosyltransferase n=1 Tax=Fusobacterium sp. IOR10 TaxID=2665157 RepID=UPI0013D7AC60|nr:methionine adenosyltransferase [Fusobacterium sp. IOR10]